MNAIMRQLMQGGGKPHNQLRTPEHLSISSIQLWSECPRSWAAKYLHGLRTESTSAASFGNAFDQAVSQRHKDPTCKVDPLVEVEVDLYLAHPEAWTSSDEAQKSVSVTPDQWANMADTVGCPYTMKRPLIGYIDLFRGGLVPEVLDLKTSQSAAWENKWLWQIMFYSAFTGAKKAHIHLLHRKKNEIKVWTKRVTDARIRETMNWMGFHAANIERAIESFTTMHDLPAQPGMMCRWCPIYGSIDDRCPLGQGANNG